MGRLKLAFQILFNRELAERVINSFEETTADPTPAISDAVADAIRPQVDDVPRQSPEPPAERSEALVLLAALQREARLVDFLMESLEGYSDAQVGAAARDVHRDSQALLERLFAIQAVIDKPEGTAVELANDAEAGRIRLTGEPAASRPSHGTLVHHGWEATKCDLPTWTGSAAGTRVLAPAEVDV